MPLPVLRTLAARNVAVGAQYLPSQLINSQGTRDRVASTRELKRSRIVMTGPAAVAFGGEPQRASCVTTERPAPNSKNPESSVARM
jgi:hypothetical protein